MKKWSNLKPRLAQVVTISMCHGDECFDCVNVFGFHLCDRGGTRQQGEPSQGLNICVSLKLLKK